MKKEYDLEKMKRRPKVSVDPEAGKVPISIRLDGGVIAELRTEAERLGLPYQSLISSILHRFVHGQLIDRKDEVLRKEIREMIKETLKHNPK